MNKNIVYRFILFFCLLFLTLVFGLGICYITFQNNTGLLMFKMLGWLFIISTFPFIFWCKKYKNVFESFLVSMTCFSVVFSFIMFAPCVVERSLSTFIFFYAAETGKITKESISSQYISTFISKRFNDGVESSFLTYENEIYHPTFKTKLFYWIYYPLGKITNTLTNYNTFKNQLKKEESFGAK